MSEPKASTEPCDSCHRAAVPAIRYGLVRRRRAGKRVINRGLGSIMLCDRCWSEIAEPRMRKAVDTTAE